MEPLAPDPAARLETIVAAVAARAEQAARRLDALTARLDSPPQRDPADPVRLAAIELAVAGTGRDRTAEILLERFPAAELDPVLDDVFG